MLTDKQLEDMKLAGLKRRPQNDRILDKLDRDRQEQAPRMQSGNEKAIFTPTRYR